MLKLFKKKPQDDIQDNSVQGMVQELVTHGINGGQEGVKIAIHNMLFTEVYNWAKRSKKNGVNVTKEILIKKMNEQFFGNKFAKAYSNACGYNEQSVDQLADEVLANI